MTHAMWRGRGDLPLRGSFAPPGDKSISHRALLFNALAEGAARVDGVNPGADVCSTASCLRALGVQIRSTAAESYEVQGRGLHWRPAPAALDCGNSGTTARMLAGILAGQAFTSTLDGDASLRLRPMGRIAAPLRAHGARVEGPDNGAHLPLILTGPLRRGGCFESPVASAQLKSAMLLAALVSEQTLRVEEPLPSRDHSEILLSAMGAQIESGPGWAHVAPGGRLSARDLRVPGDPSAAAFPLGAAALIPGSEVTSRRVLLNPTRAGFVEVLRRMGVEAVEENSCDEAGERIADLHVAAAAALRATRISTREMPTLLDEVPLLAVVAAFAEGNTVFESVGELRVKESDRVAEVQRLLAAWAIETSVDGDVLVVHGGRPRFCGESYDVGQDHRMAMASAVLALASAHHRDHSSPPDLDLAPAAISDPNFTRTLESLQDGA